MPILELRLGERLAQSDAEHVAIVLNRVESLGILACEHIRVGDIPSALKKLAEMGEGIRLVKSL